jgi:hypothetical protein
VHKWRSFISTVEFSEVIPGNYTQSNHGPGGQACWNEEMIELKPDSMLAQLHARYRKLSVGKKAILIVFLIWLAQALPKWTAAIGADDELSADIMRIFITPRSDY